MSIDNKPSNAEEEYFARENAEKMRKLAADQAAQLKKDEREKLRSLHHMRCPKCGMQLQEVRFRGVAMDRCFSCGGTFLDAGELEQLASPERGTVMQSVLNIFSVKK